MKELDNAKNAPFQQQHTGAVEDDQHGADPRGKVPELASNVKDGGEEEKEEEHDDLKDHTGPSDVLAGLYLLGRDVWVGEPGGAVGEDNFTYDVQGDEGCEDAAWVNGGQIGHVVHGPSEDYVQPSGESRRAGDEQDLRGNIEVRVAIIPCTSGATDVASGDDEGAPEEEQAEPVGLVVQQLNAMDQA